MIARVAREDELPACFALRRAVFVVEQNVPEGLELDGLDPHCTHFVAFGAAGLVGTARLREYHGSAKAERVAVLASERGSGAGAALMAALEAKAKQERFTRVILNAQIGAVPFYLRLGYHGEGPFFEEAGIAHLAMIKPI